MNRLVAMMSMVVLAGSAGCGARSDAPRSDAPRSDPSAAPEVAAATPDLPVADRAEERSAPADRRSPEPRHGSRRSIARPRRAGAATVAMVESQLAARMPGHDRGLHRQLASVIHEESRHAGLDPLLVLALIHVESSLDPLAESGAGAVGLMQLREPTMRNEIKRWGLAPADPLDPVANVRAGIRYLRRLVRLFGNTNVALMAYNAGPNRIGSYRRAGQIPERFFAYPRRIQGELERLRSAQRAHDSRRSAPDERAEALAVVVGRP
jgi:soluble lytic murein transglycosylase-like protein